MLIREKAAEGGNIFSQREEEWAKNQVEYHVSLANKEYLAFSLWKWKTSVGMKASQVAHTVNGQTEE